MTPNNSTAAKLSTPTNFVHSVFTCAVSRFTPVHTHFFASKVLTSHLPALARFSFALSTFLFVAPKTKKAMPFYHTPASAFLLRPTVGLFGFMSVFGAINTDFAKCSSVCKNCETLPLPNSTSLNFQHRWTYYYRLEEIRFLLSFRSCSFCDSQS